MTIAVVTFLYDVPDGRQKKVEAVLAALDWRVGDAPAAAVVTTSGSLADSQDAAATLAKRTRNERLGRFLHFFSIDVLPTPEGATGDPARLLFEAYSDCAESALPGLLAAAIPADLGCLLAAVGEAADTQAAIAASLLAHRVHMGTRLLSQPGLAFQGTPGMSVRRIRDEAALVSHVRELLRATDLPASARGKVERVRQRLFADPAFKWALFVEPVPLLAKALPHRERVPSLIAAALRDYLWALLPLPLLVGLAIEFRYSLMDAVFRWSSLALLMDLLGLFVFFVAGHRYRRLWVAGLLVVLTAVTAYLQADVLTRSSLILGVVVVVLLVEVLVVAGIAAIGYRRLREQETVDQPIDREPDEAAMRALMLQENEPGIVQNHLVAQAILKPGWVRQITVRAALWSIAELSKAASSAGFLNKIGTIHFARWYVVPGSRRLVFLANYDGSWQSYLEDFIARLRAGISSIWSNAVDFPKTSGLVDGGAADGARFKRWVRRQQLPTGVWFAAYPTLTTGDIRSNAAIRHDLLGANSESLAFDWLARLGYASPALLDRDQVPTLVFGRLPKLLHAHALVVRLGEGAVAREWLAAWMSQITFGKHDDSEQALAVAFTVTGLDKLGLPAAARRSFPVAFQQGMGDPGRARLLGDVGDAGVHGPPRWGLGGNPVDLLCIAYGRTKAALDDLLARLRDSLRRCSHAVVYERAMGTLPAPTAEERSPATYEPFGFRDNVSQPILRGATDWANPANAMHLVQPGEFVLGYPDNQSSDVPTPGWNGIDLGRNGTYLVVRHLSQDRQAFDDFIARQVVRLRGPGPVDQASDDALGEWIAAKMMGRWRSGASLVRSPDGDPASKPAGRAAAIPDNDYLFGKEDPDGQRCPFGAHVRRANPRESADPESDVQLAISNRHRILRVGRALVADEGEPPGLFFMCLNADIERQFEFLQQTWLNGPNFLGLDHEVDPVLGPGGADQAMTLPTPGGPRRLEPLQSFVKTLGGGYFFMPGRDCLALLASGFSQ